jgi:predicted dehydrogenase
MGPYPVDAVRQLFEAEPTEAFAFAARRNEPRFAEIDEMLR